MNLMRYLARSRKCWNRKFLCFTDSMVVLGALGKGRSSSPPLLRLCRRAAAMRLILGIRIFLRYVASEVNVADWPSRGGPVGVAPKTKAAHADRA